MKRKLLNQNQNDKLNSKVGKTFTYKELMEFLSKQPNKIRAIVS